MHRTCKSATFEKSKTEKVRLTDKLIKRRGSRDVGGGGGDRFSFASKKERVGLI